MRSLRIATLVVSAGLALAGSSPAAILYPGGFYIQDYNSLPNTPVNQSLGNTADARGWIDDTASPAANQYSISGWYIYHPTVQAEGGINGHQRLRVSGTPTTAATGSFYSYGDNASTSTERALGVVPSATLAPNNGEVWYGLRLTNNTTDTLTQFTLNYTGEQWRVGDSNSAGGGAGNESLTVDYRLGGTDLQSGTYTEIPGATFDSPVDVIGSTSHLNGNDPANRVTGLGATVTGISWTPGTDLWLRWTAINKFNTGVGEIADHGLAIDDLTFIGEVPEPSTLALSVLFAVTMLGWRRER
jgi:hypothetical protein